MNLAAFLVFQSHYSTCHLALPLHVGKRFRCLPRGLQYIVRCASSEDSKFTLVLGQNRNHKICRMRRFNKTAAFFPQAKDGRVTS